MLTSGESSGRGRLGVTSAHYERFPGGRRFRGSDSLSVKSVLWKAFFEFAHREREHELELESFILQGRCSFRSVSYTHLTLPTSVYV